MMQLFSVENANVWPGVSALQPMASRGEDPAWKDDTKATNYRLKDGDSVELKIATKGDFSKGNFLVPSGTKGVVAVARTPRVRCGNIKSVYFANVDIEIDGIKGRIRVPHGVLRILR